MDGGVEGSSEAAKPGAGRLAAAFLDALDVVTVSRQP